MKKKKLKQTNASAHLISSARVQDPWRQSGRNRNGYAGKMTIRADSFPIIYQIYQAINFVNEDIDISGKAVAELKYLNHKTIFMNRYNNLLRYVYCFREFP